MSVQGLGFVFSLIKSDFWFFVYRAPEVMQPICVVYFCSAAIKADTATNVSLCGYLFTFCSANFKICAATYPVTLFTCIDFTKAIFRESRCGRRFMLCDFLKRAPLLVSKLLLRPRPVCFILRTPITELFPISVKYNKSVRARNGSFLFTFLFK